MLPTISLHIHVSSTIGDSSRRSVCVFQYPHPAFLISQCTLSMIGVVKKPMQQNSGLALLKMLICSYLVPHRKKCNPFIFNMKRELAKLWSLGATATVGRVAMHILGKHCTVQYIHHFKIHTQRF